MDIIKTMQIEMIKKYLGISLNLIFLFKNIFHKSIFMKITLFGFFYLLKKQINICQIQYRQCFCNYIIY